MFRNLLQPIFRLGRSHPLPFVPLCEINLQDTAARKAPAAPDRARRLSEAGDKRHGGPLSA